jgi:hypothetical protein
MVWRNVPSKHLNPAAMAHSDPLVRIYHSMCMSKCRILHLESQLNSFKLHKSKLKLHTDKDVKFLLPSHLLSKNVKIKIKCTGL